MTSEESVFAAALEWSDPAGRRSFLDHACAGDAALRRRVDRLLAADERARGILERTPDGRPIDSFQTRPPLAAGLAFDGRFALREKLGEGGMGEVWVADQLEPVRRQVALKVVRPGLDSGRLLARFGQERQALALMDHPNIARVLDAGVADGRPYFVMELIDGVPITAYCDEARLSVRERLELFLGVCHAVQHAHQKGVIHRDLKPTNVLVAEYDGKPVPKVIDFGVAKAARPGLAEPGVSTEVGTIVGTLEYMSPEQAELNGLDVDTRSDIYSLGVVLYELLTGIAPFSYRELRAATFAEALRTIREVDPPRPSTRLSGSETMPGVAVARRTEPRRLTALLRGELDWVVMKCLEKDRARRYETANGLAADVQRYLSNEVVDARPPSAGYRLRKFVRRNRGPVLAAGLVLLALVGGVVGTTVGLVRAELARNAEAERAGGEQRAKETAEKRLAQIERGVDALGAVFDDLDPAAEEKEGRPLRAILGDRLDRAAADLDGEAVGDPLVVARLQDRLGRTYLGLGHAARAEALFAKAHATRQAELGADHPLTLASASVHARACYDMGRRSEAVALFERTRDAQVTVLGAGHPDTLTTLNDLAEAYRAAGRRSEAVTLLEQVRDERVRQLGEDHDLTLTTLSELARAYANARRFPEAIALAEKAHEALVRKHGADHPRTFAALYGLARVHQAGGQMRQAVALLEKARDVAVAKLGPDHPQTLSILNYLASMYRAYRRLPEAIALAEKVREAQVMTLGVRHPSTIDTLHNLASAYKADGKPEKALPLFQQAAAGAEGLGYLYRDADRIIYNLCQCHEQLRQYDQAEVWRRKRLAMIKEKDGPECTDYVVELKGLGSNLLRQNKSADAEPILRECLAVLPKTPPAAWESAAWMVSHTRSLLGAALIGQGQYADAEPLLVQGYVGMREAARDLAGRHYSVSTDGPLTEALERLVHLYDVWDKPDEAARWRRELEALRKDTEALTKPKGK